MKTKKLKVEGSEKLKFELIFDLDEIKITLFDGGKATKYTETLTFSVNILFDNIDKPIFEIDKIGESISKLLIQYTNSKHIEKHLVELFDGKEYVETTLIDIPDVSIL